MKKGALALLVHGGTENWSPERWKRRFDEVCSDRRVLLPPDAACDPAEIHYAAVWKPYLVKFMSGLPPMPNEN